MPAPLPGNIVEKAYELARSGKVTSVLEIQAALARLGYTRGAIEDHLTGTTIRKQLSALCRAYDQT